MPRIFSVEKPITFSVAISFFFSRYIHSDEKIGAFYYNWEEKTTKIVMDAFPKTQFKGQHKLEKVHMIIQMVENYCHEVVFHKHKDMDYDMMKQLLIQSIIFILEFGV